MEKENQFKASSVEAAIEKGLKKLGLSREEVEIEVISEAGIFTKAQVKLTKKEVPSAEENDDNADLTDDEIPLKIYEETVSEEKTEEKEEERPARKRNYDDRRRERDRHERKEYFPEEKALGKEYLKNVTSFISDRVRIDAKSFEDEICFYIGGEDASSFIGHRGETLDAIQYLVGQVINKDKEEGSHIRVTVDADFYRERRKKTLTALAKRLAFDAYNKKQEISLEPMNSYERRIIHSALQRSDYATTRSDGEGKNRHVVIVPKCEVMSYGNTSAEFRRKGPGRTKSYGYDKIKF